MTAESIKQKYLDKGYKEEDAQKETNKKVDYQTWAYQVAKPKLDHAYLQNLSNNYHTTLAESTSKNPLKFREFPSVTGFFDSTTAISNTTFLRGAISALEATSTGKQYMNPSKDRAKNSTAYEDMLKALKNYYAKTAGDDKEGIVSVKRTLKEKCLA